MTNRSTDIAIKTLLVLAAIAAASAAKEILIPITLAVLLQFILTPLVVSLHRLKIPRPVSAALVIFTFFGMLSLATSNLLEPAEHWANILPNNLASVESQVRQVKSAFEPISSAAERLEKLAEMDKSSKNTVVVEEFSLVGAVLSGGQAVLARTLMVVILLFFLLAYGAQLGEELAYYLETERQFHGSQELAKRVASSVTSYLSTIALINLGLGVVISISLYLIGLPNPLLWGAMATLLNFIPYLGIMVGTFVVLVVSLMTFDSAWLIAAAPLCFYTISAIEGNFVTPALLGKNFSINPILIFTWLIFCSWLWGIPGAFLAVPVLLSGRIIVSHSWRQKIRYAGDETPPPIVEATAGERTSGDLVVSS